MTAGTSIHDKFYIFAVVLGVTALFLIYDLYNSEMYQCPRTTYSSVNVASAFRRKPKFNKLFGLKVLDREIDFNLNGSDVIVFLHIQKTGGTSFGKHLVKHLDHPCTCVKGSKRCDCNRPGTEPGTNDIWLFSRYSTGWTCGLHADWTELNTCVPQVMDNMENAIKKRRYFYVTMLRNPLSRYLSEWRHVQRGATWKKSRHLCDGRLPTEAELPKCYKGDDWEGVGLDRFMNCKWNLANNRQTRMLADLSLVGCYNLSKMPIEERSQMMLRSAKRNLRRLAFFGLTEYQAGSQFLFEETFKLNFKFPLEQVNETNAQMVTVTPQQFERIKQLNHLDMDLYDFAKVLFIQRKKLMETKKKHNGTLSF